MRNYSTKYRQTAIYILLLIAVLLLMGLTRRCNTSGPLPYVAKGNSGGDTLDVGILYGPMSFYTYNDTLGGLNYDILNIMENDLRQPLRLWPAASLRDALESLQNGKFDIIASLPSDKSIKDRFNTTKSVFLDRLVLLQLADSTGSTTVNSVLELGKDTIFIPKDSPAAARLKNLSAETDNDIPFRETDLSEEYLCMKVASGDFHLAVVNEKIARHMKESYPRLSYDNPISFTQFQVWLLNPADTILLHRIDKFLDSLLNTSTYKTLIDRYR